MAGIPGAHGGDRNFIGDPQNATNADAIGDLSAAMQLMMHIVSGLDGVGAAGLAALNEGRDRVNTARQAVEAIAQRDVGQREPPPLTNLPAEGGFGANPLGNTRFQHIPKFETRDGRKPPPGEVFAWLSACAVTAETAGLTEDAFYALLLSTCTGAAFNCVNDCRQADMTIVETVRILESRYGDLLSPADAGAALTVYQRSSGASACNVLDDLRRLAKFQFRTHPEEGRRERIEELVRLHLLRVLPREVTSILNEEIRQANATGAKVPSNDALATRAERLEAGTSVAAYKEPRKERHHHHERQVQEMPYVHEKVCSYHNPTLIRQATTMSEAEIQAAASEALSLEQPVIDEEGDGFVDDIIAIQQVVAAQNPQTPAKHVLTAAIRQYNNNRRRFAANQVAGSNQMMRQGPPNKLGNRNNAIEELLKLANVNRGECLVCGIPGHIRGNIKCAMRNLPLMDIPCTRCGRGLHGADVCTKVLVPVAANACTEEPLNE